LLERYLRTTRRDMGEQAKDEILAFFKQNVYSPESILAILKKPENEGGLYDYFARPKQSLQVILEGRLGKEHGEMIRDSMDKVFGSQYHKLLDSGVDAYQKLSENGFSRDQVMAILIKEPLERWNKVAKRILSIREEAEGKITEKAGQM